MRRLAALAVLSASCFAAGSAQAVPPCRTTCRPAGEWVWNHQFAELALLNIGIEVGGRHYDIEAANCYGIGAHEWSRKGPEFQKFHCSVTPYDDTGAYDPYGLTLYVRGRYAWTWG